MGITLSSSRIPDRGRDGALPAKVGATQRCVLTVDQTRLGVTVNSGDVDTASHTFHFHAKVDNQPLP